MDCLSGKKSQTTVLPPGTTDECLNASASFHLVRAATSHTTAMSLDTVLELSKRGRSMQSKHRPPGSSWPYIGAEPSAARRGCLSLPDVTSQTRISPP